MKTTVTHDQTTKLEPFADMRLRIAWAIMEGITRGTALETVAQRCHDIAWLWQKARMDAETQHLEDAKGETTLVDQALLQRQEFDAAYDFTMHLQRLNRTPIVDNDYPEVRHLYESALANLVAALKANGRFAPGNRYGLLPK